MTVGRQMVEGTVVRPSPRDQLTYSIALAFQPLTDYESNLRQT